jgi:antirestriction protein ArdC
MSTSDNTATNQGDVYARVTSQIINAIENGVSNWRMPWHTSGRFAFSPVNVTSKKPYRGINTVCRWSAAEAKGYHSGEWGTYKQWQEHGAQVRKGEKATTVVFWKFANGSIETQDDGGETTVSASSRLLFTRGYSVFNASQVDGYTPKPEPDITVVERIEQADSFYRTSERVCGMVGTKHTTRLLRITFKCRRSKLSLRTCHIIRSSPMSTRTGQRLWAAAIGN